MDIKIGVQDHPREIHVESARTPDDINAAVREAVNSGGLLSLDDENGTVVLIPGAKIAYVEITPKTRGRVGFGSPA